MTFQLDLPDVRDRADIMYPPRQYRRSWTYPELMSIFPALGVRILEIGPGDEPFRKRDQDQLVSVDFDESSKPTLVVDVTKKWPFGPEEFDFIYMSHVLEHFYPYDRDALVANVHRSLRPGGLIFIRVPHRSGVQGTGWEHYSYYGLNGVTSLCHGHNPNLPVFRAVSTGVAMSIDFYGPRSITRRTLERLLNRSWRLTEAVICYVVGGIPEVQFVLQRLSPDVESCIRQAPRHDSARE
jgi:SAM-dependent methyltransferase